MVREIGDIELEFGDDLKGSWKEPLWRVSEELEMVAIYQLQQELVHLR